jgi:hypothetical protein
MANPVSPDTLLEQYKAYMGDLGNIGSRYATSQTFYMSVVSGLIAVVAFAAKETPFSKHAALITAVVLAFIALICLEWWRTLTFYGLNFGAKFAVLKKMEEQGLYPIFTEEWNELQNRKSTQLVTTERTVPVIVGVAAALGTIAAVCFSFGS